MSTRFVRRYWLLLIGTPLLAVFAAFIVSRQLTPQYQSTATIVVLNLLPADLLPADPGNGALPPQQPSGLSDLEVEERVISTYVRLVERASVLEAVRENINFSGSTDDLAAKVSVSNPADTQLIEVRATDPNPDAAATIANAVATEFVGRSEAELGRAGLFVLAEQASAASSPSSPNIPMNVMLAFIVGSIAAVSVALVLDRFNRSLLSTADVEEVSALPLLGAIPRAGTRRWVDAWASRKGSSSTDAYRRLRTTLVNRGLGSSYRSLYVTSQDAGAGKSVFVGNLGVALANAGRKVVLIDLNLKDPSLHKLLGVPNQLGIADYLSGRTEYETLVKATAVPRLSLIPAGATDANAEDLVARSSPQAVVQHLLSDADIVIIDGPAVSRSSTAILLPASFDASLIVVAGGRTTEADLQHVEDTLAEAGVPVLGVVMNMTRSSITLRRRSGNGLEGHDLNVLPDAPRLRPARPEQR